ncbi:unnamed protein product [Larinioides sclopetarius]|uniref:Uncharacterized protein n=1 Tax=Larinioides sclopetarius TaxID=280406 RepID=A0AAV1ZF41_9ARAC
MKVFIWLLFLMIEGSTAFMCNDLACDDSPLEELARLEFRPKKSELLRLCPSILDFFNCYFKGVKKCLGTDVSEIAESGDGIASVIAESLLKARSLAVTMCDKESTLRKDYLANVECFDRLVEERSDACRENSATYAEAFLRQRHNLKEENVDWEELDCLKTNISNFFLCVRRFDFFLFYLPGIYEIISPGLLECLEDYWNVFEVIRNECMDWLVLLNRLRLLAEK